MLIDAAGIPEISSADVVVTNIRHYEGPHPRPGKPSAECAKGSQTVCHPTLVAQDLRDCLHSLAEIVGGEITTEENPSKHLQTLLHRKNDPYFYHINSNTKRIQLMRNNSRKFSRLAID